MLSKATHCLNAPATDSKHCTLEINWYHVQLDNHISIFKKNLKLDKTSSIKPKEIHSTFTSCRILHKLKKTERPKMFPKGRYRITQRRIQEAKLPQHWKSYQVVKKMKKWRKCFTRKFDEQSTNAGNLYKRSWMRIWWGRRKQGLER